MPPGYDIAETRTAQVYEPQAAQHWLGAVVGKRVRVKGSAFMPYLSWHREPLLLYVNDGGEILQ